MEKERVILNSIEEDARVSVERDLYLIPKWVEKSSRMAQPARYNAIRSRVKWE